MQRYFYSGATVTGSAISRVRYALRVPDYYCEVCNGKNRGAAYHLGYPEVDIVSDLTKADLAVLKCGAKSLDPQDDERTLELVARLQTLVSAPIGPGAYFGPISIAVTSLPQYDFEVLMVGFDVFLRREALLRLGEKGFALEFVECPASGKYADSADFVQLVIPCVGSSTMAPGYLACPKCFRFYGSSKVTGFEPMLSLKNGDRERHVFKTLLGGKLAFSGRLVEAVRELGLTGLDDRSMLRPFVLAE